MSSGDSKKKQPPQVSFVDAVVDFIKPKRKEDVVAKKKPKKSKK